MTSYDRNRRWVPFAALCAALLLSASGCPAPAEEELPASSPARDAARLMFDAMHGNDWGRVADQLHPEALAEVKSNLLPLLQQAAQGGGEQQILGLFAGVDSMEAVAALSDRDFFNRYLSGRMLIQPNLGEMLRQASTEILGELPGDTEGEAFVVYRFKGDPAGVQFENLDVVKVRLEGETWKPLLTDDLKSLARPF